MNDINQVYAGRSNYPRRWRAGWLTKHIRVGLLTMRAGETICIHDHPDTYGLLITLTGSIMVRYWDVIAEDAVLPLAELKLMSKRVLTSGAHSWFTPTRRNVHDLCCQSGPCRLLDITLHRSIAIKRAWYLPVTKNSNNCSGFIATRIMKPYLATK